MVKTVRTKITSLEDLIEVFPSLTETEIMRLYLTAIDRAKYLDGLLGKKNRSKEETESIVEKWGFYKDCEEFLSGFLARMYCNINGFTVR